MKLALQLRALGFHVLRRRAGALRLPLFRARSGLVLDDQRDHGRPHVIGVIRLIERCVPHAQCYCTPEKVNVAWIKDAHAHAHASIAASVRPHRLSTDSFMWPSVACVAAHAIRAVFIGCDDWLPCLGCAVAKQTANCMPGRSERLTQWLTGRRVA